MTQSHTLKHSEHKLTNKRGWKIFFWTYLSLLVLVIGASVFATLTNRAADDVILSIEDWVTVSISVLSLIGLYGFCYEKAIWSKLVWPEIMLLVLGGYIFDIVAELGKSQSYELALSLLFITAFTIAELLALYKYSFHSPEIWDQHKTTT